MPKLTLTFDPVTVNQKGSSSHQPQLICEFWKWLGKYCSCYRVHKVKRDGHTYARTHPHTHAPTHSLTHPTTHERPRYYIPSNAPQLTCEVWKWLGQNCSRYRAHKVLYIECQSWPWPLTPWSKINRVPPLIIHNLHVKFESDWAKTVVAIVPTRSYT